MYSSQERENETFIVVTYTVGNSGVSSLIAGTTQTCVTLLGTLHPSVQSHRHAPQFAYLPAGLLTPAEHRHRDAVCCEARPRADVGEERRWRKGFRSDNILANMPGPQLAPLERDCPKEHKPAREKTLHRGRWLRPFKRRQNNK